MTAFLVEDGRAVRLETFTYCATTAHDLPLDVIEAVARSPEAMTVLHQEGAVRMARRVREG